MKLILIIIIVTYILYLCQYMNSAGYKIKTSIKLLICNFYTSRVENDNESKNHLLFLFIYLIVIKYQLNVKPIIKKKVIGDPFLPARKNTHGLRTHHKCTHVITLYIYIQCAFDICEL